MVAFSLLSLIYGAGLAQAAFLVFALGTMRVRHSAARWVLVAIVVTFSMLLAEEFLDEIGLPLSLGLGLAVEFALAPLIYLFARSMFRDAPPALPRDLWHFAPLVVAAVVLAGLNWSFPRRISVSNPDVAAPITTIVLLKIVFFFVYAGDALRLPLPDNVAAPRRMALRGLRRALGVCVVAYGLSAAAFLAFLAGNPLIADSDAIGAIIVAASVYAVGYYGLVGEVLDVRDPYGAQGLAPDQAKAIRERAANYLLASETFRDPDLKLDTLARRVGVKAAELTQALNGADVGGYKRMINRFRIDAYLLARADPANKSRTILELAFDAGFNSKATFYRVLKSGEYGRVAESVGSGITNSKYGGVLSSQTPQ